MKLFRIMFILLFLILSMGLVSAQDSLNDTMQPMVDDVSSFEELEKDINNANDTLEIEKDYRNDNYPDGITVGRDNLVINGNNHTIDGNGQRIFSIRGSNITINNLIFINACRDGSGGAIDNAGKVTLNNVAFVNNSADKSGGAIYNSKTVTLNNVSFVDNSAVNGGAVYNGEGGELSISNAFFSSKISDKLGQIYCINANMRIVNSTFLNITSSYSPALYIRSSNVLISNSSFINLTAEISAGAISIKNGGNHYIEGCEFINTSSSKNAGALNIDISGNFDSTGNVTIVDTLFKNTYSDFGGALIQLGGNICLNNSDFIDNGATYNGGSVYLSFVDDAEIYNCTFDSNGIKALENITVCGSAIYCDISNLTLSNSRIINKSKGSGSAVYACDSSYIIANSIFMGNANAIYTDFDRPSSLVNNVYGNGSVSTNNTPGTETIMAGEGMQLKLLNNSINVTNLPSRFDLRDWNWTSPVGDQGLSGSCWAFATIEALESALRKACEITTPFSINNMQKTMIRYSNYGIDYKYADISTVTEGGSSYMASSYLVSWLGALPQGYDIYDEVGKISRVIKTDENIHIQDVIFILDDDPGSLQMKSAILKYGSLRVSCYNAASTHYFNPETNAQYVNDNISINHGVEIVGWDDNYPKENFLSTPPGDGAWICKNSRGSEWGDNGFFYLSYYDKSLLRAYAGGDDNVRVVHDAAVGVIVENTIPYNKNYQYDIGWNGDFDDCANITYANVFEALDDDLIAAVGTYFSVNNTEYRVDVYVNGELKLTQEGSAPNIGFHTIKLDEYVPIKAGDVFSAVITSNSMPYMYFYETRVHYNTPGCSYMFENGSWVDLYDYRAIACVKVYTVADNRHNTTLIAPDRIIGVSDAIYGYDYQFILKDENGTALANKKVLVSFNGENQTVLTDEKGWGTVNVKANAEGTYAVEIIFKGSNDYYAVSQNATIKLVRQKTVFVAPDRVVYVRDMSNGYEYSAILKDNYGKALANKKVLFIFKGKKQVAYTDENGWATVTLTADTAGVQTLTIKFAGDRCYQETVITKTIKVVRESSALTTVNKAFVANDKDKKVTATLKSKSGNPIYGAKVTFTVGGKTYSATTGDDGVATFSIDLFKLGTFHASTRFEDSRFYAAAVTESKVIIY